MKSRVLLTMFLLVLVTGVSKASVPQISRTINSMGRIGSNLEWLYVSGNKLMDGEGEFFLVGAHLRGQARNPATDGIYDDWRTYAEQDATRMEQLGFNVIRLGTHWECVETSKSPSEFTYDNEYIEKIRQTVEIYNSHNIYVIIALMSHGSKNELGKFVPTLGKDTDFADEFYSDNSSTSAREHLKRLWLRMSQVFKDYSGVAGYDICNEPHHSSGSLNNQQVADLWFDMADYITDGLRANEDNHIVFVNFSPWARYTGFMSRKLNDSNVVYEPHFYYGINEWDLTVKYNDYDNLKSDFDNNVNAKMLEFDVPFYMGEQGFGGHTINTGDDRDIWLKNTLTIFKTSPNMHGWTCFCWISYNGNPPYGSDGSAFFGETIVSYASDKPTQVHFEPG